MAVQATLGETTFGTTPTPRRRLSGVLGVLRPVVGNRKALAGAVLLLAFVVLAAFPGQIAPHDPVAFDFMPRQAPSTHNLLGTTDSGQDVLSQLIYGTRASLEIAFLVGLLATVLSVLVGVSSAYLGGLWDGALSFATDAFLVIPTFPLVIVIAAYLKSSGLFVVSLVLVVTGWSYGARQLRAQALSLRNRDFLEAARVRGERPLYVIVVEMLPTMTSLIVANFLGAALYAVLTAAGLQFIGLGDVNSQSWGSMLYFADNADALQGNNPMWEIAPGLCVALLGAAFALLNYAFDEVSNPALRPARRTRGKRDGR